ncbi:MFS transporter [Oceanobacillus kimchii]|uniref:MFS transporter n=2 Tax=Oceanobacillus TaxID=182709 RepID=A0ABQ5TD82_9BACI|nr:MFS transporter [Oceanobacillus kimchii]GLO64629.1 MFS transporter [Oceanobacillus kimchii]
MNLQKWKNPSLLLTSIGIANIGDFIYLVAINILVFQMTGSAAAVAALWLIGPLTNIFAKFWTGSFIDYRSKRKVMMATYAIRGIFIFILPFMDNLFLLYSVLIILSIAKAFFNPASMTYITIVVPKNMRKRFNSIRAFASSGAFIIGPSIGGALIYATSIDVTLWINAIFFLLTAGLLWSLPEERKRAEQIPQLTIKQVMKDFTVVQNFMKHNRYVTGIYLGFIVVLLCTFAMDAQEVVFTQQEVGLSEVDYTLLISITGIGSVTGAILLSIISNKLSLRMMIVVGLTFVAIGYIIYAFSWSFISITIGFIILGFFLVFLNAGMMTFYQNNIPIDLMGRVTSIFDLIQSTLQVLIVLVVGLLADIISLRGTIVSLSISMFVLSIMYMFFVLKPTHVKLYQDAS